MTAGQKVRDKIDEFIEPWSSQRISILNKYTTLEKLSIVTSFLPGGEKGSFSYLKFYFQKLIYINF